MPQRLLCILGLSLALLARPPGGQAGETHLAATPGPTITDSLYCANHPRLLFTPAELPALRLKVADGGYDDDAYADIRRYTDLFITLSAWQLLLGDYGATTTAVLGAATHIPEPEDSAAAAIGRDLTTYIADTYDVDNDEGGSSWRLQALALGYDNFFKDASESLRGSIRDEMVSYLQTMVYSFPYSVFKYRPYLANHSAMMVGAMGLAAICLDGEADATLLGDAIDFADEIVDSLLTFQFDPYGSYKEGASYAGFTMRNLIYYFEARKRFDGMVFSDHPRIRRLENWLAYEVLPEGSGRINNIQDCPYSDFPLSLHNTYLDWAQSEWGSNLSAWIWEHTLGPYGFDIGLESDKVATLLWNRNLPAQQPDAILPNAFLWKDRGLYYYRTGWQSGNSSDDVVFSFFSGRFHGGHWQEDINQFTLYGYGESFAIDHGPGAVAKDSRAHNMVFVDGEGQHNAGSSIGTDGAITEYVLNRFADYVQGDATQAYTTHSPFNNNGYPFPGIDWSWGHKGANPVLWARRNVVVVHEAETAPYFIVTDDISKDGGVHSYEWRLHTRSTNTVDALADPIRISGASGHLDIHAAGPGLASLNPSTTFFDNATSDPDATLLTLTIDAINPHFAFILIPGDGTVPVPSVARHAFAWGSANAIDWGGGLIDWFVYNHGGSTVTINLREPDSGPRRDFEDALGDANGAPTTAGAAGPVVTPTGPAVVKTDAALLLLRTRDGDVEDYVISNASRFQYGLIPYVTIDNGTINCARSGSVIDIDRHNAQFIFYGPNVTEVRYRRVALPTTTIAGFVYPDTTLPDTMSVSPSPIARASLFPNPFNPSTRISLELTRPTHVRVRIYDVLGRLVATVWEGVLAAGTHRLQWDGANRFGRRVASGTYFVRVESGNVVRTLKLTVVK